MLINCVLQLYYPEPNQVYTYRISVWIAYLVLSHLFEQPLKEPPSPWTESDDGNFTNFILCNYYKLSSSSTAVGYSGCSYNAMQWQLMGVSYRVKSFSSQASRKSEWQPSGYSSAQVLTHLLEGHIRSTGAVQESRWLLHF